MKDRKCCPSHCCKTHGCKYRYDDCPVRFGDSPGIRCEQCEDDEQERQYHTQHLYKKEFARLNFLEQCLKAGISICPQPRMFKEDETVYCVRKQATFLYPGGWETSYTYPAEEIAQAEVEEFFKTGKEPTVWWNRAARQMLEAF